MSLAQQILEYLKELPKLAAASAEGPLTFGTIDQFHELKVGQAVGRKFGDAAEVSLACGELFENGEVHLPYQFWHTVAATEPIYTSDS